jgi:hypothetical protein
VGTALVLLLACDASTVLELAVHVLDVVLTALLVAVVGAALLLIMTGSAVLLLFSAVVGSALELCGVGAALLLCDIVLLVSGEVTAALLALPLLLLPVGARVRLPLLVGMVTAAGGVVLRLLEALLVGMVEAAGGVVLVLVALPGDSRDVTMG